MNNIAPRPYGLAMMKTLLLTLGPIISVTTVADAACVAEYKAKRSNPTQYEHGRMNVPDSACTQEAAMPIVRAALADRGWTLMTIVKVAKSN